jgi:hypothetical protein
MRWTFPTLNITLFLFSDFSVFIFWQIECVRNRLRDFSITLYPPPPPSPHCNSVAAHYCIHFSHILVSSGSVGTFWISGKRNHIPVYGDRKFKKIVFPLLSQMTLDMLDKITTPEMGTDFRGRLTFINCMSHCCVLIWA